MPMRTFSYAGRLPSPTALAIAKWRTGLDPESDWDLLIEQALAIEPTTVDDQPNNEAVAPKDERLLHPR